MADVQRWAMRLSCIDIATAAHTEYSEPRRYVMLDVPNEYDMKNYNKKHRILKNDWL